jgi:hypothetical protein
MTPLQSAQAYLLDVEHELADAHDRIRLLVAERNTARLQADQRVSLREEFRELLGTDEIEQGVVVVRGLQDRIKRLEEWKESALAVEREWDANAIATLLGAKLGESQRKVIQREVPLLLERIKRLEKSSQQLKSLNNKICEINLKVSQERDDLNFRIKRLDEWKESALEVEREWDANAVATMLGAKLGESQRKVIQREVPLLLDRIKRLEEAGDAMFLRSTRVGREIWHKAKEAKP